MSMLLHIFILLATNVLGNRISVFSDKILYWNRFINITYRGIGISSFNLFNTKNFKNKIINYVSSLSLLFYLIHENILFRNYIRPLFYEEAFKYGHILLWVMLEASMLFIGGIILSIFYKETMQKLTKKLSIKLCEKIKKIYSKIEEKLLLLN